MPLQRGLNKVRVIDFSNRIAGAYASKMFVDAGAEVIKIEPVQGDPLRKRSASGADFEGDSAFFKYLNAGKKSIVGHVDDDTIIDLIASADLLIETYKTDSDDYKNLQALNFQKRFPELVVLSISDYGRTGPYAEHAASEFTLQADSGSLSTRGLKSQAPIMAGGNITEYIGGTFSAVAALAATRYAQQSGHGEFIDFSLAEVVCLAGTAFADLMSSLWGRPHIHGKLRDVELPSIEPTKNGWVGFATMSFQQFSDFLVMIGRPDLKDQKDLHKAPGRSKRMEEWNQIVHAWTKERTTEEIIEIAALLRIPVAPVNNGKTVFEHEQLKARGVFIKNPSGDFLQPRTPYLINNEAPFPLQVSPGLGEHTGLIETKRGNTPGDKAERHLPLKGIRVLDATAWWAGPSATQMLAHLGAEVIHLEAIQRPDGARMMGGMYAHEDKWWEFSAMYLSVNTNKQGLTLNLNDPKGLALCKQLIAQCDVFFENYSPRVMEGFGLSWETVQQISPKTTMVRMPAFGLSGPWKNHVGFAQTMEQITGMAWLTGHVEDQPRIQRGPCDPMAGMNAAFATLVALEERQATGKGSLIECSMVEGALNAAAEQAIEYSAYGNILQRNGNRSPNAAPQGLYYCHNHPTPDLPKEERKKPEQWLALSIETDEQWRKLVALMGKPSWANSDQLQTLNGRIQQQDMLDEKLQAFFRQHALDDMLKKCQNLGIPTAPLRASTKTSEHPQFMARKFFEELEHPAAGKHLFVSNPLRFASLKQWINKPAPVVGEDNHAILTSILGLSATEIAELEAQEIIGQTLKHL